MTCQSHAPIESGKCSVDHAFGYRGQVRKDRCRTGIRVPVCNSKWRWGLRPSILGLHGGHHPFPRDPDGKSQESWAAQPGTAAWLGVGLGFHPIPTMGSQDGSPGGWHYTKTK